MSSRPKKPKDDAVVESTVINRNRPLDRFPPEKRAYLAQLASQNGRKRSSLPRNWRSIVVAVCATRDFNDSELARALGMTRPTLLRIRREDPAVDEAIVEACDHYTQLLTDVVIKKALAGDANSAMWLLARTNPKYADKPSTAIQNNLNLPPAPPPVMTLETARALALPPAQDDKDDKRG